MSAPETSDLGNRESSHGKDDTQARAPRQVDNHGWIVYARLMTMPDTPPTDYQLSRLDRFMRVRCNICWVWKPVDDIVWRGVHRMRAVCDECEPEGDDNR